jgi:hypothetical protein
MKAASSNGRVLSPEEVDGVEESDEYRTHTHHLGWAYVQTVRIAFAREMLDLIVKDVQGDAHLLLYLGWAGEGLKGF